MINFRPFILISHKQKIAFSATLETILNAWSEMWFDKPTPIKITHIDPDVDVPEHQDSWLVLGENDNSIMGWELSTANIHNLLAMMFSTSVGSSVSKTKLMTSVVKDCISSFANHLSEHCKLAGHFSYMPNNSIAKLTLGYGSGALLITAKIGECQQKMIMSNELVTLLSPATSKVAVTHGKLIKREDAIKAKKTNLEIVVGNAELTLKEFSKIEVGDVIRLGTTVRDPFLMRADNGEPIASVHVGLSGNYKAVKLVG